MALVQSGSLLRSLRLHRWHGAKTSPGGPAAGAAMVGGGASEQEWHNSGAGAKWRQENDTQTWAAGQMSWASWNPDADFSGAPKSEPALPTFMALPPGTLPPNAAATAKGAIAPLSHDGRIVTLDSGGRAINEHGQRIDHLGRLTNARGKQGKGSALSFAKKWGLPPPKWALPVPGGPPAKSGSSQPAGSSGDPPAKSGSSISSGDTQNLLDAAYAATRPPSVVRHAVDCQGTAATKKPTTSPTTSPGAWVCSSCV